MTESERVAALWARTVAAHRVKTRPTTEYALGYLDGLRDGLANASAVILGIDRQAVADRINRQILAEGK